MSETPAPTAAELARPAFVVTLVAAATVATLAGAWYAREVLILAFAAWLVSLALGRAADFVERHTPLNRSLALAAVLLLVVLPAIVLTAGLLGRILGEVATLARRLPAALQQLQGKAAQWGWPITIDADRQMMRRMSGLFGTGLGALGGVLFTLVLGIFFAAEPKLYRRGLLALVRSRHRQRVGRAMEAVTETVQRWLLARLLLMVVVGVLTGAGLTILQIPTPLGLGALAGLLDFIPNIGPILAAIPAGLLAFDGGTGRLLSVVGLYVAVQTTEAYLLAPLVERRAVRLAPALILLAQAVLGYLMGWLGLMFATPLTAAAVVVFNEVRGEED